MLVTVVIQKSEIKKETVPVSQPRRSAFLLRSFKEIGQGRTQRAQQRGATATHGSQLRP
jgi:hypothetical protein